MRKTERYERVLAHFREQMPNVNTELEFGSVFQLLVAVILSAQCTDKRINQVTPEVCSATILMPAPWHWQNQKMC